MTSNPFTVEGGQMPDLYLVYDHFEHQFLKKWSPDPNGGQNSAHEWDDIDTYNENDDYSNPVQLRIGKYDGHHGEAQLFHHKEQALEACKQLTKEFLEHGTPADEIDFRVLAVHPQVTIKYTTEPVVLNDLVEKA